MALKRSHLSGAKRNTGVTSTMTNDLGGFPAGEFHC